MWSNANAKPIKIKYNNIAIALNGSRSNKGNANDTEEQAVHTRNIESEKMKRQTKCVWKTKTKTKKKEKKAKMNDETAKMQNTHIWTEQPNCSSLTWIRRENQSICVDYERVFIKLWRSHAIALLCFLPFCSLDSSPSRQWTAFSSTKKKKKTYKKIKNTLKLYEQRTQTQYTHRLECWRPGHKKDVKSN